MTMKSLGRAAVVALSMSVSMPALAADYAAPQPLKEGAQASVTTIKATGP